MLTGKTALITGGGRGIGRAIALVFAQHGARVAVAARTREQVETVAQEIGDNAVALVCDVSNPDQVAEILADIKPDILVNNAGIAESATFVTTTDEMWHRHIAINLSGTFYCTRAALPSMLERGWGRIINIASIAAKTGAPYVAAYTASKHGVLGLTRSLALEVANRGITVNAICPGYVDTEMVSRGVETITAKTGRSAEEALNALKKMSPQNRLTTPEEIAALALLLASDEGRGINGQGINIDGGSVLI
ncbi:MAG TPA: SDR family NAD(P)-dependent oxidoreductase [Pyrinomonadaceae bacterium]|nr:SDR family NAD(P)-dependent oxidoreductase [Pyrinomonadaceae bacterium]